MRKTVPIVVAAARVSEGPISARLSEIEAAFRERFLGVMRPRPLGAQAGVLSPPPARERSRGRPSLEWYIVGWARPTDAGPAPVGDVHLRKSPSRLLSRRRLIPPPQLGQRPAVGPGPVQRVAVVQL